MQNKHGWGRSKQGIERRAKATDKKIDKWVKTCLETNKKLEERKIQPKD